MKKKFRHGIKGHPVYGNDYLESDASYLRKRCGIEAAFFKGRSDAKAICAKFGWLYEDKRGIIARRSLQLLDSGVPARVIQKKKFVYSGIGKAITPEAKKLATPIPSIGKAHPDYVRDDGFYKSREWKQLRYLALRNCGGGCQCCGAKASDGIQLHVDHILPRYKYPHLSLVLDNLQVLCEECNIGKGAWDDTDWREHMRSI